MTNVSPLETLDIVTIDYESYYASDFGFKKLNTIEYVQDERFLCHQVGIQINDESREVYWGEDAITVALEEIDWSNSAVLAQNTMFDGFVLTQRYGHVPAYYCDTMAMATAHWPGQSATLKDVALRIWPDDETMRKGDELAISKGKRELTYDENKILSDYCDNDVFLCRAIFDYLLPFFPQKELDLIDLTTRMMCEPTMVADTQLLTEMRDKEQLQIKQDIEACGAERAVLSSNPKFFAYMQDIGLSPPTKINAKGKVTPCLGQSDIPYINFQAKHPEYATLWRARKSVKSTLKSTRSQRFLNSVGPNGTIPGPLRYYAAHTGRFGGTEKLNMQNLPRQSDLRLSLCAPKDEFIYVTDLSAIEARITAWLADETTLLMQFKNGICVYSDFAGRLYSKKITKKDNPVERHVGKTAQLGLGFGMGPDKFSATLESGSTGPVVIMPMHEVKQAVYLWRNTYSNIPTLWKRLEVKLANTLNPAFEETWRCLTFKNSSIILPNGMALKYNNLRFEEGQLVYDGKNKKVRLWGGPILENIAQALARIVLTDAMLAIDKDKDLPGKLVLQVHDELLYTGSRANSDNTLNLLNNHLCAPKAWAKGLPLAAEGGYDFRYSK